MEKDVEEADFDPKKLIKKKILTSPNDSSF